MLDVDEDDVTATNADIEEAEEQQKVAREKRILERFVMAEINLLEKSHFAWN